MQRIQYLFELLKQRGSNKFKLPETLLGADTTFEARVMVGKRKITVIEMSVRHDKSSKSSIEKRVRHQPSV